MEYGAARRPARANTMPRLDWSPQAVPTGQYTINIDINNPHPNHNHNHNSNSNSNHNNHHNNDNSPRSSAVPAFFGTDDWGDDWDFTRHGTPLPEDIDESLAASSPRMSPADYGGSPSLTGSFGTRQDYFSLPWSFLGRVDSGLSLGNMHLRDESRSPAPLPPIGEVNMAVDTPMGVFEMDQLGVSPPQEPLLPPIPPMLATERPAAPPLPPAPEFGRRSTDPGVGVRVWESIPTRTGRPKRPWTVRCSQRRCDCPRPDRAVHKQKIVLGKLPTEILIRIFQYAIEWPPPQKLVVRCPHGMSITRRFTTGDMGQEQYGESSSSALLATSLGAPAPPPAEDTEEARHFGVKTLLRLGRTCKRFLEILTKEDSFTDKTFWMVAARRCWKWLPPQLADVQGHEVTSQTSWRNLVAVFMRSENSQFGTRKSSGKGGVDCFGGKKPGTPAIPWTTEARRREEGQAPRRLLLACAQPGPDHFTVTPDEDAETWTISFSVRQGEFQVRLDEHGQFSAPCRIPDGWKRGYHPGYFEPGIFEYVHDKSLLVKMQAGGCEAVRWNLACIPDFRADEKAHAARCASRGGVLVCSLFTHHNPMAIDTLLDPPEDARLYCVESEVRSDADEADGMSSKRRGKMPSRGGWEGEGTVFRWRREFQYRDPVVAQSTRRLHPVICNLKVLRDTAVALVRWNLNNDECSRFLYDREFHVLNLRAGETVKLLVFPDLYWDYRHHDMSQEYNTLRVQKLQHLYNPPPSVFMGPGNRSTRIHNDAFCVTDTHIMSGSHDYCNWIWPLHPSTPPSPSTTTNNNNEDLPTAQPDPFIVLDDYYWNSPPPSNAPTIWNPRNERAGWWVKTPNQVLCFWHNAAVAQDGSLFAVCRPGKLFVWDLESGDVNGGVSGYTCLSGGGERERWLGRPEAGRREEVLNGWYLSEDVVPEQGMWLVFEDGVVYVDREEILEACGIQGEWWRGREEFGWEDEEMVDAVGEAGVGVDGEEEEEEEERERVKRRRFEYGDELMEMEGFWNVV